MLAACLCINYFVRFKYFIEMVVTAILFVVLQLLKKYLHEKIIALSDDSEEIFNYKCRDYTLMIQNLGDNVAVVDEVKLKIGAICEQLESKARFPRRQRKLAQNIAPEEDKSDRKQPNEAQKKPNIHRVNITYDLEEFLHSFKEKIFNTYKLNVITQKLQNKQLEEPYLTELKTEQANIIQQQQIINVRLFTFEVLCKCTSTTKFAGTIFISFLTKVQLELVLEELQTTAWHRISNFICRKRSAHPLKLQNQRLVNIQRAPGPSDVIWENMNFDMHRDSSQVVAFATVALLVLSASFFTQWILVLQQYEFYFGAPILFGIVLKGVNTYFNRARKYASYTLRDSSLIKSQVILETINSVAFPSYFYAVLEAELFNAFMRTQIRWIVLVYAALYPLSQIFDARHLKKLLDQQIILHCRNGECPYTQYQANKVFEPKKFSLWQGYSYLIVLSLMLLWFLSFLSLLQILAAGPILIFHYWNEKWFALKVCRTPPIMEESLMLFIMPWVEWLAMVFFMGFQLFRREFHFHDLVFMVGLFVAAVLYQIRWQRKVQAQKQQQLNETCSLNYEDARSYFKAEYAKCNPVTVNDNQEWRNLKSKIDESGRQIIQNEQSSNLLQRVLMRRINRQRKINEIEIKNSRSTEFMTHKLS